VPRCGALSLLQKTPHNRGGREIASRLNVKIWYLSDWWWWHLNPFFTRELKADTEIKSRRGVGRFAGPSRVLVCASVLRALPPAAPPASPVALSVPPQKLLPAGPPKAHAEVLCRRCKRYKHASVVERPPQRYGHRLKLAESINLPL
jgi:hypothetical protein